jgi:hypothetical protein
MNGSGNSDGDRISMVDRPSMGVSRASDLADDDDDDKDDAEVEETNEGAVVAVDDMVDA